MGLLRGWDNPVLVRELRGKGRGLRFYVLVFVTWFVLAAAVGGYVTLMHYRGAEVVQLIRQAEASGAVPVGSGPGIILFAGIASLMFGVATYAPPALAATVISREREQQSLGSLLITRLTNRQVLWGKLLGSVYPVLIALLAGVPFLVLCGAMGRVQVGITLFTLAKVAGMVLASAAVGLMCSVLCRSTPVAVAVSYVVLLFLFMIVRGTAQYIVLIAFALIVAASSASFGGSPSLVQMWLATNGVDVVVAALAGLFCFLLAWVGFNRLTEE